MSVCKSMKDLAAKVALSPVSHNSENIRANSPKSFELLKKGHLLSTPHLCTHDFTLPSTRNASGGFYKIASPVLSFHASPQFRSREKQGTSVVVFGRHHASPRTKYCARENIVSGSPLRGENIVEVNTPLRQDMLQRPNHKRRLKILGKGAFGLVFLGNLKGRRVAVKIAQKRFSMDSGEWNCLNLQHPHIIRILDITENLYHRLIVMEYAGLCNLQQVLDNAQIELSLETKFRYSHHIASAVRYCHKQSVLHLDIKPANVVVSSSGCCKLGDFGCSVRIKGQGTLHSENLLQGTVAYTAPELFRGFVPSAAADTYSLAIVFWQLLTRRNPFQGEDQHVIIYKVVSQDARPPIEPVSGRKSNSYVKLIKRCWEPYQDKRPSLDEIVQELIALSS